MTPPRFIRWASPSEITQYELACMTGRTELAFGWILAWMHHGEDGAMLEVIDSRDMWPVSSSNVNLGELQGWAIDEVIELEEMGWGVTSACDFAEPERPNWGYGFDANEQHKLAHQDWLNGA